MGILRGDSMRIYIGIIILVSIITSCGHMINPAPPKVELTSTKDQSYACEEINTEILDLQTKRVNTQKQIDNQKAQNVLSGIGGWLVIVPFVFIDATTDKNAAYNSYAEREEYLRKLAMDKNCTNLPMPYEFPTQQKQTTFVPSGGNIMQSPAQVDKLRVPEPPQVTPIDPDKLKVVLLRPKGWDVGWSRPGRIGEGSCLFETRGEEIVAKMTIIDRPWMNLNCERDVIISSNAVKFDSCAHSGIALQFDPNDQVYPFKGKGSGGVEYKLTPK
jgi:hypothetical protein